MKVPRWRSAVRVRSEGSVWKPRSTISARNILIFAAPGAEACGALRRLAALCGQLRRTKFVQRISVALKYRVCCG